MQNKGLRQNDFRFFSKRMSEVSRQKQNTPHPFQSEAGQFHFPDIKEQEKAFAQPV
jgi:hypothetical protein